MNTCRGCVSPVVGFTTIFSFCFCTLLFLLLVDVAASTWSSCDHVEVPTGLALSDAVSFLLFMLLGEKNITDVRALSRYPASQHVRRTRGHVARRKPGAYSRARAKQARLYRSEASLKKSSASLLENVR